MSSPRGTFKIERLGLVADGELLLGASTSSLLCPDGGRTENRGVRANCDEAGRGEEVAGDAACWLRRDDRAAGSRRVRGLVRKRCGDGV